MFLLNKNNYNFKEAAREWDITYYIELLSAGFRLWQRPQEQGLWHPGYDDGAAGGAAQRHSDVLYHGRPVRARLFAGDVSGSAISRDRRYSRVAGRTPQGLSRVNHIAHRPERIFIHRS